MKGTELGGWTPKAVRVYMQAVQLGVPSLLLRQILSSVEKNKSGMLGSSGHWNTAEQRGKHKKNNS